MMRNVFRASRPLFAKDKYGAKAKPTFVNPPTSGNKPHGTTNSTTTTNTTTTTTTNATATTTTTTTPPPRTRSGIVYADGPTRIPLGKNPHVFESPTSAAQHHGEIERKAQDSIWNAPKKPEKIDAEDYLTVLNRIRAHPVYKVTRVFVVGTSVYLISRRIQRAEPLEEEKFTEDAPLGEKVSKQAAKAKRIAWATIQRVWSPWDSSESMPLTLFDDEREKKQENGENKENDQTTTNEQPTNDNTEVIAIIEEPNTQIDVSALLNEEKKSAIQVAAEDVVAATVTVDPSLAEHKPIASPQDSVVIEQKTLDNGV